MFKLCANLIHQFGCTCCAVCCYLCTHCGRSMPISGWRFVYGYNLCDI